MNGESKICPFCENNLKNEIPILEHISHSIEELSESLEDVEKQRPDLEKYVQELKI